MCTKSEEKSWDKPWEKHWHKKLPFPLFPFVVPILFPLMPMLTIICEIAMVCKQLRHIEDQLDEITDVARSGKMD